MDSGTLSEETYGLLTAESGLSPLAVQQLLSQGRAEEILSCQQALHTPPEATCRALLPFRVTCEERSAAVPLAPLEPGDLLITFSTHTLG